MSKYDELKRLAEVATPGPWERGSRKLGGSVYAGPVQHWANGSGQCQIVMTTGAEWMNPGDMERNADFIAAANPATILELIAENERNQRMLLAACVDMGAIGEALGADMNSDGEELLSMVVDMKAENERLERKNANQCETIRHYQDQINGGDTSLTMLIAERDQMRELLMRLVDLQNSGRGPIRSYELWNDLVNEVRPLLGLEVRNV